MPSLGEASSGGAKRFLVTFLGVCKKVTRRKGGTLSRRYRSNGYAHQHPNTPDTPNTPLSQPSQRPS